MDLQTQELIFEILHVNFRVINSLYSVLQSQTASPLVGQRPEIQDLLGKMSALIEELRNAP